MTGLTLIGLDEDGAHLVVENAEGERLRLPVTDELRRTVRRAVAPVTESSPVEAASATMSPREIQQRLRAGLTAVELAELTGVSIDTIEKFSAPILAERRYVIDQAQGTRIGRDQGSPILYDLVMDRLAARGVNTDEVSWEAWRSTDEPWRVAADFRVDGRGVRAAWTYDHTARSLTAEDEEARWLTETQLLDAPIPRRHLSAVRADTGPLGIVPAKEVGASPPSTDRVVSDGAPPSAAIPMPARAQLSPTEALLEELDDRRGTRESMDLDADDAEDSDVVESFAPPAHTRTASVGFGAESAATTASRAGHPAGSGLAGGAGLSGNMGSSGDMGTTMAPAESTASAASAAAVASPPTPSGGERKPKRGRASVPSWDEIVFGARQPQQPE